MTTRFTADDVQTLDDALNILRESHGYRWAYTSKLVLANDLEALKERVAEAAREANNVAATA